MAIEDLRFTPRLLSKPAPRGLTAETTLQHFVIVTYWVATQLAGVSNLEAGLVLLTHPMRGYFFRRDGVLGSYTIWHDRTTPTVGEIREARYPLLQRLELVPEGERGSIHSVLLQPSIDFTIYLPPSKVNSERAG